MDPFLGEIRIMSFSFAPRGWALCNGQVLPINQNQALFSLLGTIYGGDGRQTFALPNLIGSAPMHIGNGHVGGEVGGQETHTLTLPELPRHNHSVGAVSGSATASNPTGNYLAASNALYQPGPGNTTLAPSTVSTVGGSQPHENRQPYLTLSFAIALNGVFPSRN